MADLIVLAFPGDVDEAEKVRASIKRQQKGGWMSLDDAAVVIKDADGKVHVKNEVDRGQKVGAIGGGLLGLLVGGMFLFPFIGLPVFAILTGVVGGGIVGRLADMGISQKFVKEVTDKLTPGSSALFFIVRDTDFGQVTGVLRPYKGEVFQTTLTPEAEEQLRDALKTQKPS